MLPKNTAKLIVSLIILSLIFFTSCKKQKILTVTPISKTISKDAGNFTISVTSNTDWVASCNADWCVLDKTSGSNDATITITYEATTVATERTATISFSGTYADNVIVTITQEAGEETFYLKKRTYYAADTISSSYTIKFNDNFSIAEINYDTENQKSVYEYNSEGLIIKMSYYSADILSSYITYEYNTEGKIIKELYTNIDKKNNSYYPIWDDEINTYVKGTTNSSWRTYEYSNTGKLIKRNYFSNDGILYLYTNFEYNNDGNIIKEVSYRVTADNEYKRSDKNYTYDNKKSVFLNLSRPKIFRSSIQKNNLTSRDYKYYNQDGTISRTSTWSGTYEYNENDFPTKLTEDNGNYVLYEYISVVSK